MKTSVEKIIGKTITGVVVTESDQSPRSQVFLIFSDNTSYEFWSPSSDIQGVSDVGGYGKKGVMDYIACNQASRIIFEAYKD